MTLATSNCPVPLEKGVRLHLWFVPGWILRREEAAEGDEEEAPEEGVEAVPNVAWVGQNIVAFSYFASHVSFNRTSCINISLHESYKCRLKRRAS